MLDSGNGRGAVDRLKPLLAAGLVHADVYALFGLGCRQCNMLAEARTSFNAAINLDPDNPAFWAALADLLEETEDWTTARIARSRQCEISPDNASAAIALGEIHLRLADPDAAEPVLRRGLSLDPGSRKARHSLAVALRMLDRFEEAGAVLAPICDAADAPIESVTLLGHIAGDLGNFEAAVGHYRSALLHNPKSVDALETMSRLLPQLGQVTEALDAYRNALAADQSDPALWVGALSAARNLASEESLLEWSAQAIKCFPDRREFMVWRADALGMCGDVAGALALLEARSGFGDGDVSDAIQAAHWRLVSGDPALAERHAQRAVETAPETQAGWAYLGTCWRLLEDRRETWLNDYERLTTAIALEPPQGFADIDAFLVELTGTLSAMHMTLEHPADQSLRHGTQTRGHLFLRRNALITAFALGLHRQVEAWLATLPNEPTHPFLRRNTGRIGFKHSWSVRLRDSGFHINHIHQDGWLSSAFYVSLPPEVAVGVDAAGAEPQGMLTFGAPDASLGLDLSPKRIIHPQAGTLTLFPSYVWHGTTPFTSASPRLTVAFDALPM